MATQILLSVDKPRVSVAPGASVELIVNVRNLTTLVDEVAVRLEGIDPGWVQVVPQHLPVFAQGQASARVIINPPRDPARALAGVYPLRVCATSQENPGEEGETGAELGIQLVGDYRLSLDETLPSGVQESSCPLRVQNSANAPLQLRFRGSDSANALWLKFDPFQLTVPAGGEASALLTIRARHASTEKHTHMMDLITEGEYQLQGSAQATAPTRQANGQFYQLSPATLSLALQPQEASGITQTRYQLTLENPGQTPITVRLSGADDDNALDFHFEPGQLTLHPQSISRAAVVVSTTEKPPSGQSRTLPFRVAAAIVGGGETRPAEATATFMQVAPVSAPATPPPQPFPWWVVAIVLLALFLMILLGLVLVRP